MAQASQIDPPTDGVSAAVLARPVVPPPLEPRFTPRALTKRIKALLAGLSPPKVGSEEWLKRHRMLVVGAHSYLPSSCVRVFAGDSARVSIGKWCSIAGGVEIMPGGNHRTDTVTTYPIQRQLGLKMTQDESRASDQREYRNGDAAPSGDVVSKGDVTIGNDVWIGRGAKILGGVTIGDGAVIAAWSVVTKSVGPYTIAAGVPARPVRQRFSGEIIESLLRICWWDWDDATVIDRVDELTGNDLTAFARRYDPTNQ